MEAFRFYYSNYIFIYSINLLKLFNFSVMAEILNDDNK